MPESRGWGDPRQPSSRPTSPRLPLGAVYMRKHSPWLLGVAALAVLAFSLVSQSQEAQHFAPPMAGIHWARGEAPAHARTNSSPNLIYHGGPVLHGTVVEPIFWGDWSSSAASQKIAGVQSFYSGVGSTSY